MAKTQRVLIVGGVIGSLMAAIALILSTLPEKIMQKIQMTRWMRRLGRPEETANVYAFLASEDASFVNEVVLEVSGGLSMRVGRLIRMEV